MRVNPALKSIGARYTSGDFTLYDNTIPFPSCTRQEQTGLAVAGVVRPAVQQCLSDENKSAQRVPEKRLRLVDGGMARSSLLIEVSPDVHISEAPTGRTTDVDGRAGVMDVQPLTANRPSC